jgi:hypothetical protein
MAYPPRGVADGDPKRILAVRASERPRAFVQVRSSVVEELQALLLRPARDSTIPVEPAEDGSGDYRADDAAQSEQYAHSRPESNRAG